MVALINRVGETYNNITIVEELGNSKVRGLCNYCSNDTKVYIKGNLMKGMYGSCGCQRGHWKFIDRTNEVYNNIKIIEDNNRSDRKVKGLCLICNREATYNKKSLICGKEKYCKYGDCANKGKGAYISRVGKIYRGLEIIEELPNKKVMVKCTECKTECIRGKSAVVNGTCVCRNTECKNYAHPRFVDLTNREFGDFVITKEVMNNDVEARCIKCNTIGTYTKDYLKNGKCLCNNCGVTQAYFRRIEGHIINNITVTKFSHTGRNKKQYYYCKCNTCGEEIVMSYDDIFTYQCDKET